LTFLRHALSSYGVVPLAPPLIFPLPSRMDGSYDFSGFGLALTPLPLLSFLFELLVLLISDMRPPLPLIKHSYSSPHSLSSRGD